jgi:hypothetical protein
LATARARFSCFFRAFGFMVPASSAVFSSTERSSCCSERLAYQTSIVFISANAAMASR